MLIEDTGRTVWLIPERAPRWHQQLSMVCLVGSTFCTLLTLSGVGPLRSWPHPTSPSPLVVLMTLSILFQLARPLWRRKAER